jgi:uncharacterized protein (DUF1330 family)
VTAYVISDVRGLDPDAVARYRELASASIARHGGSYLTRIGAVIEVLEGDWSPSNVVVVAFPSTAAAREWYRSADYAEALEIRREALSRNLLLVSGADED